MEDVIPHRERTFDQLRESGVVRWWKVLGFSIWCCTQSAVNGCTFQMQMNEDVSDPVSISSSAEIIAECNTWQLKEDDTIITDTEAWYADDPVAVLLPQALDSGGRIILSLEFMVNQLTPHVPFLFCGRAEHPIPCHIAQSLSSKWVEVIRFFVPKFKRAAAATKCAAHHIPTKLRTALRSSRMTFERFEDVSFRLVQWFRL